MSPARIPSVLLAGVAAFFILAGCTHSPRRAPGAAFELPAADLAGGPVRLACTDAGRALVLAFIAVDCPIANRAQPELHALARELEPAGVRFVQVYANADETAEEIRRHRQEFSLTGEAVRDPGGALVARCGVQVTPEVVALAPDGALIYQGRVNDQYAAPGVGRPAPTRHDLAEALREYLRTGVAAGRRTPAAGCAVRPAS